jgi:hypothetical protein
MVSGLHDEPQTLAEVGYVACGLFVQVVVLEGDVLMDAAVPGWNTVQREGISTSHTSRCLLINSGIHNQEALCNEMLELNVETDNYTKGFLDKQCKNCESNILKSWDPGKSFGQKCFVVQIVTPATQCVVGVVLMLIKEFLTMHWGYCLSCSDYHGFCADTSNLGLVRLALNPCGLSGIG